MRTNSTLAAPPVDFIRPAPGPDVRLGEAPDRPTRSRRETSRCRLDLASTMAAEIDKLRAHARVLTRSRADADDLVQDAIERGLRYQGAFVPGTNLGAWLRRILRNRFVDSIRERQRDRRLEIAYSTMVDSTADPPDADDGPTPPPSPEALDRAIQRLPEKLRTTFIGRERQGLSYRALSERLGVPVKTVGVRLLRARRALCLLLTENGHRSSGGEES